MKMNLFRSHAVAMASLVLCAAAVAQSGTAGTTSSTSTGAAGTTGAASAGVMAPVPASSKELSRKDSAFVKQAAENGHAEVESSKLAATKAHSSEVKAFAQQMVDDHTKNNEAMAALATAKGLTPPTGPSLTQRAKIKMLSARNGASFDQHYVESMGVEAHEQNIKLFQEASTQADDADVKAFAAKTLPALQSHLQMAQALKKLTDAAAKK